jgi:hypothetical protein
MMERQRAAQATTHWPLLLEPQSAPISRTSSSSARGSELFAPVAGTAEEMVKKDWKTAFMVMMTMMMPGGDWWSAEVADARRRR